MVEARVSPLRKWLLPVRAHCAAFQVECTQHTALPPALARCAQKEQDTLEQAAVQMVAAEIRARLRQDQVGLLPPM